MEILVCEQRDLALEPAERVLLERPSHEIRACEERERHCREDGGADREPQARLEGDHASLVARASRRR
jgi:hypothetical protein